MELEIPVEPRITFVFNIVKLVDERQDSLVFQSTTSNFIAMLGPDPNSDCPDVEQVY